MPSQTSQTLSDILTQVRSNGDGIRKNVEELAQLSTIFDAHTIALDNCEHHLKSLVEALVKKEDDDKHFRDAVRAIIATHGLQLE